MRGLIAAALPICTATLAAQSPRIEDNSFLVEEAYNQEAGVVQHIGTWQRSLVTSSWSFSFTQEWPLRSQLHQFSYTLLAGSTPGGAGFGGLGLNYRYQLRRANDRLAISPRLSLLIPAHRDRVGTQVALPLSARLVPAIVAHANVGMTATVRETTRYNLGGSVVWLARPTFNVLCELTWADESGGTAVLLNPGIRWAYNFASGLQIVPGLAFPVGLGPSRGSRAIFLYLSFEHPFGEKSGSE